MIASRNVGQVLEQAVEERGGDEQVGVLHVRDRLRDRVRHAEALRHALGERATRDRVGTGDPERGVHAGDDPELVDVTPERPERLVLDEVPRRPLGATQTLAHRVGHRAADLPLHRVVLDDRRRVERGPDDHRREALLGDPVELAAGEQRASGAAGSRPGARVRWSAAAKSQIQSL